MPRVDTVPALIARMLVRRLLILLGFSAGLAAVGTVAILFAQRLS
jgi:hypothetical protein